MAPKKIHAPSSVKDNPSMMNQHTAFYLFLASHLLSAIYSPIADCDEVFNYWEPTHYLSHGHALQTWEYSPDFAIRSWAYAGIHALVIAPLATILPVLSPTPKILEFYLLRSTLALVCALCEARLFAALSALLHRRVAIAYLAITLTAPGMYHASTAYLPSSFAMYSTLLGLAAFLDWRGGLRTAQGIFCFGVGACIGWPFAAAVSLPFLAEEAVLAALGRLRGLIDLSWRVADGLVRLLLILALQISIDSFFYKKFVVVPWNIIHYNIFSPNGPDLYGTEPWHFYLRNLVLNFHLYLLLALAAGPLLLLHHFLRRTTPLRSSSLRALVFTSPFYLWLAIMTLQPHKEERFLYPAYPALILNASISIHLLLSIMGSLRAIPMPLRLLSIFAFVLLATFFSTLRVLGTWTAFSAPLSIYTPLHTIPTPEESTVCLGKEWYRFPSHFLLPTHIHAKFIPSDFHGLLPGEFSPVPANAGFGMFPGTWLVPAGMNGRNEEDPGKLFPMERCDFLVDVEFANRTVSEREPKFIGNGQWEEVRCERFLDVGATAWVGRLGWVPEWEMIPPAWRRKWGNYCLLKRRRKGWGGLRGEEGVEGVGLREGIETLM